VNSDALPTVGNGPGSGNPSAWPFSQSAQIAPYTGPPPAPAPCPYAGSDTFTLTQ
jgi:hypothetical protein